MSTQHHNDEKHRGTPSAGSPERLLEENVDLIRAWEKQSLQARSGSERLSDWIVTTAGSPLVVGLHVLWFSMWVAANRGLIPGIVPFDRFPFPFLTMTVSLEAIFLSLFVLASQNRLTRQSDMRSHLDLQINLLAEREMTAVLQLLQDVARHLNVNTTVTPEQLRALAARTDLGALTKRLEDMAAPEL